MENPTVEKPADDRLKELGVEDWGVWEKDQSQFDWSYSEKETCYILEGAADVRCSDGTTVSFSKGDLVTFPKGLNCTWNIRQKIRKKYMFGE